MRMHMLVCKIFDNAFMVSNIREYGSLRVTIISTIFKTSRWNWNNIFVTR